MTLPRESTAIAAAPLPALPPGSLRPGWDESALSSLWPASLVIHCTVLVVLGHALSQPPSGAAPKSVRESGIVLVSRTAGGAEYFAADIANDSPAAYAGGLPDSEFLAPVIDSLLPPAKAPQLPDAVSPEFGAAAHRTGLPSAREISDSPISSGASSGRGSATGVQTQVFGIKGAGSKFVYVFDRSSSMEGIPLAVAKRELLASLASLQSVHQFQILFYNQEPHIMTVGGRSRQLVFADEPGKRLASNFVGGIHAYGATDHLQALRTALAMRPDVIFFLTDAEEPQLTNADFETIRRLNRGTLINAIEFGAGPPAARFNFLVRLAQEHGGRHTYVDVSRLVR